MTLVIKALIIEDHYETGQWLSALVSKAFEHVETHHVLTITEADQFILNNTINLALVDINLPDGSGIDFLARLQLCSRDTYSVIVTIYDDADHLFPAIRAGADGYILKDQSDEIITEKLKGILKGDPPLSPAIARKMLEYFRSENQAEHNHHRYKLNLTRREEEVLVLVARGLSRREIAETLNLSIHTIARYIKDLYRKLDINSRAEAAIIACQVGLIKMQ